MIGSMRATMLSGLAPWQQRLAGAAALTVPGLLVRLAGGAVPYPLQLVGYGTAVVAAAFMLAWACEAAQVDIGHGLVVAGVAFVAILPEYVVEVHFAFVGHAEFVTANLTGASRLLLGFGVALPAIVGMLPARWRPSHLGPLELAPPQRVDLGILGLAAVWALRPALRGKVTLLDAVVLISLYVFYLHRVAHMDRDGPEMIGVARQLGDLPAAQRRRWVGGLLLYSATVILLTAVPFSNAVLGTGALVGISPYLLLQWLVPVATETPEIVVALVLLMHGRGGQSVAVLLASAVSQYTLALGTLPVAFLLGAGAGPLPLQSREQVELVLTTAVALYAVSALVQLRLSRGDASIMLMLFSLQFLLPTVFTRGVLALVFTVLAIDVFLSERPAVRALVRAMRPDPPKSPPRGGAQRGFKYRYSRNPEFVIRSQKLSRT
jgi:cation:H+ antiporter